ncbi:MAG TPA: nuclear transport factor 2 family protein [Candidatus Binataceae bacterium]|nr:nuclear transport factor 2 family protein [Candidatus Binataceae bacterium]
MKIHYLILISLLVLPVLSFTGGVAGAKQPQPIDPVKTCGVGPAEDIVAIDQLWDAYAHNLDSGDANGVADLFADNGGYILLYNNRQTQTLVPMGYSPNGATSGTDGTSGGGCTALGHDNIVAFLTAIGLGNDYPRPQLGHHIVTAKCINVQGNKATMTAYWNSLTGPDDEAQPPTTTTTVSDGGQYDNTFVMIKGMWYAVNNQVIFDVNNPNFPCRNE